MLYKWLADVLDGAFARHCDRSSALGGALDTAADAMFLGVAAALLLSALSACKGMSSLRCQRVICLVSNHKFMTFRLLFYLLPLLPPLTRVVYIHRSVVWGSLAATFKAALPDCVLQMFMH